MKFQWLYRLCYCVVNGVKKNGTSFNSNTYGQNMHQFHSKKKWFLFDFSAFRRDFFLEDCFHISMEIGNEKQINASTQVTRQRKSDIQCQKNEKRLEDWRRKERKKQNNKKVENRWISLCILPMGHIPAIRCHVLPSSL